MPLPHYTKASVARAKLTEYLLAEHHPIGRHKCRVFRALGYDASRPAELELALLHVAATGDLVRRVASRFGVRYSVDGTVEPPLGGSVILRTIWFVAADGVPRFVTAYPKRTWRAP